MTNVALIFDERNRDQNEYYEERHALFVFGEFENPEQTFHSVWHRCGIRFIARLTTSVIVMLSEAKHLWLLLRGAPDRIGQRLFALRSE